MPPFPKEAQPKKRRGVQGDLHGQLPEKLYLKLLSNFLEGFVPRDLGIIGGVRGHSTSTFQLVANLALEKADHWGMPVVCAKIDLRKAYTNITPAIAARALYHIDVPPPVCCAILSECWGQELRPNLHNIPLHTNRLHKGSPEGAPTL